MSNYRTHVYKLSLVRYESGGYSRAHIMCSDLGNDSNPYLCNVLSCFTYASCAVSTFFLVTVVSFFINKGLLF